MVHKNRTIPITNQIDIHAARMYTREYSRVIGMELVDQARVSLATSTLAECLRLGASGPGNHYGQVVIQGLENGSLPGLQIDFEVMAKPVLGTTAEADIQKTYDCVSSQLNKIQALVDDVQMEILTSGNLHVRLVKWQGGSAEQLSTSPTFCEDTKR